MNHGRVTHIGLVTLVVRDYDEAIDFYVRAAGFSLVEDSKLDEQKRPGRSHTGRTRSSKTSTATAGT